MRGARALAVAGLVVVGAGAVVACQPGGLGSSTAAYTTQTTSTAALKRQHVDVSWLTCTGDYGSGGKAGGTPSPTETTVVSVNCQGETKDGRKITVSGKVTKAVDGACVRGDLTAKVGGRQVFHADGLGDCDTTPGPTYTPPAYHPGGGRPTVTVTVTETVWCKGDPTCWPAAGK
ncbi:hypothetical protein M878_30955 [Streptomyces roseochromogenus subsp. oscitans DS 12.976]|uniref:Lipoprotein n=1 Tax=Streptomyces roseochromogenus subsp. oscitans DS 12.976 TaxID=1352936 RepID=V6JWX5_STRRC|nr:hypothetical protein M878_30955 [Streptomyces roseochromogenus subsp. oscitans DS 12.976]